MAAPAGGAWQPVCPQGRRAPSSRCLTFRAAKGSTQSLVSLINEFSPNLTPEEVLKSGSFGGTYFRDIYSSVTLKHHKDAWKELPKAWISGLDIEKEVARPWEDYDASVNKFKVKCGNTLDQWEKSGWMRPQDPYGWFQWYCRFFRGRRTHDDERQIRRWLRICGPTGRWKSNLIAKCVREGRAFNDPTVAPVVRQSLHHWAYELSKEDWDQGKKKVLEAKGIYAMSKAEFKGLKAKAKAKAKANGKARARARASTMTKAKAKAKGKAKMSTSRKRPAAGATAASAKRERQ